MRIMINSSLHTSARGFFDKQQKTRSFATEKGPQSY
eukprot:COSAG01_NODE_4563_length_4918_cov_6.841701_1_plen_36_part_00